MKVLKVTTADVKESINRLAQTDDGKIVLAWIHKDCGFGINLMSYEDPNVTQVYAAKRGVYASLRKNINPDYLVDIEYRIVIEQEKAEKSGKKEKD